MSKRLYTGQTLNLSAMAAHTGQTVRLAPAITGSTTRLSAEDEQRAMLRRIAAQAKAEGNEELAFAVYQQGQELGLW